MHLPRVGRRRVWTLLLREMLKPGFEGNAETFRLEEGISAPFYGFAAHVLLSSRGKVFDFTLASHAVKIVNHERAPL
eukprot:Skav220566  [mRNA]  locus=scaffold2140:95046:95276:+ [translate_table: standard]